MYEQVNSAIKNMTEREEQSILDTLEDINEHVDILNNETGELVTRITVLENQMQQVLWLDQLVVGAIILTVLGAGLTQIIKKEKKRQKNGIID